ncbi:MAG: flagellar basal body-associated FliL family protein [Pseudomonadota bacterium]
MADSADIDQEVEKKSSKLPLLLGLVLTLAGGGVGFFVVYSGMLDLGGSDAADTELEMPSEMPLANISSEVAFVEIQPLVVTLEQVTNTHLRFRASLEVAKSAEADVTRLMPRVVDVLNSYLRAVEVADLQDRSALTRLRAQMLRRVQVVAGGGRVKDLLIMEFVLN